MVTSCQKGLRKYQFPLYLTLKPSYAVAAKMHFKPVSPRTLNHLKPSPDFRGLSQPSGTAAALHLSVERSGFTL